MSSNDDEPVSIVHFVNEQYCKSRQKSSKSAPNDHSVNCSSDGIRQEIQKVDDLYRNTKNKMLKKTSLKDLCNGLKVSKKKSFNSYVDHVQKGRQRSKSRCGKRSRDRSKSLSSDVDKFKEECENIINNLDDDIVSEDSSCDNSIVVEVESNKKTKHSNNKSYIEDLTKSIQKVTENFEKIASTLRKEDSSSELSLQESLSDDNVTSFQTFLKDQQMGCNMFNGSSRVPYDMSDVVECCDYEVKVRGKKCGNKNKKR